jgi:methyl-accepting chemotaxis protein
MTMKIATRMWLPTATMTCILVVMAVTMAVRTKQHIVQAEENLQTQAAKLADATAWQAETNAQWVRAAAVLLSSDPVLSAHFKPEMAATVARVNDYQKRVEAAATEPEEKAALVRVAEARKNYIAGRGEAIKLREAGQAEAAVAAMDGQVKALYAAYRASQQAYVDQQQERGKAQRQTLGEDQLRTVWAVTGLLSLVVLGLCVGTMLLVRSVRRPLDSLAEAARRIGDGDLDVAVEATRDDEIGSVQRSLAAMRDSLRTIVGQVRESTESIQVASAEVASGNIDLSQRTEQAASNLQQTAGSLQQLTGNVRQSADAAAQANQLAASASAVAQRGGSVVAQVVSTMDEINHSSKRIADIIGTIDGIAFQTNILALNAAVEAARAGEQGRGFAVVASEVRSLAQRSAEAAREIKTLIGTSVDKVETGARLVQDAGSTMNEIVASVQRVTDVIGEITAAAAEQSSGIGSVNAAISSLDQMTQQNAALVEESAAAAESLNDQARRLSQAMGVFRLSTAQAMGAPAMPVPAPARKAAHQAAHPAAHQVAHQTDRKAAAVPRPAGTPPAPARTTPAQANNRPEVAAQAVIQQARESSRPPAGPAPAADDWESF